MPTKAKQARLRNAAEGVRWRRLPHSVTDLRNPRVRVAIRREARLLPRHPDNAAVDGWLEFIHDPGDWS